MLAVECLCLYFRLLCDEKWMVDKPQKRPFYSHIWCCSNNLFDIISDHDMILARNDFCPEEKREKRKHIIMSLMTPNDIF